MAPIKVLPSRNLVHELLDYDPTTGIFVWKSRPREMFSEAKSFRLWNHRYARKTTGCIEFKGYLVVIIGGRSYKAHRLAWLYVYGEPVPNIIDHIDQDRSNNRIDNLRSASNSQNMINAGRWPNNGTGVKGVRALPSGRFEARIGHGNQVFGLGTFDSIDQAIKAYQDAAIRLYGKFIPIKRGDEPQTPE